MNKIGKKAKKDKVITIRVERVVKEQLEHNAKKKELTLSEYLVQEALAGGKSSQINIHYILTQLNEICNYVEEEYSEDKKMRKWVTELWERL